jgi:hypothetical protein
MLNSSYLLRAAKVATIPVKLSFIPPRMSQFIVLCTRCVKKIMKTPFKYVYYGLACNDIRRLLRHFDSTYAAALIRNLNGRR